jgi:hypothetical protein
MPASQPTHRFRVGDPVQVERVNPTGNPRTPHYIRGKSGVVTVLHGSIVNPIDHRGVYPPLCSVLFRVRDVCSAAVAMTRCRSTCTRIGSCPPALATSRLWTDLLSVSMSALGQKQTCAVHPRMSALCQ